MLYKDYLKSEYWKNKKNKLIKYQKEKECWICGSKKIMRRLNRGFVEYKFLKEQRTLWNNHQYPPQLQESQQLRIMA